MEFLFFLVFVLIALFVAFRDKIIYKINSMLEGAKRMNKVKPLIVLAVVVGIVIFFQGFYTVNQGERAIILRFGKVVGTADPGFHVKVPIMHKVVMVDVRTRKLVFDGFESYSKDIQPETSKLSVNYIMDPAKVANIYEKYGMYFDQSVLQPQIFNYAKNAFGQKDAQETINARNELSKRILSSLQEAFAETGFVFESVNIEDISFSAAYEKSVEDKMKANVEVATAENNRLKEEKLKAIAILQAEGRAESVRAEAKAKADAIKEIGEAEAQAIRAKNLALAENPDYPILVQAEKWNGVLPTTMVPGASVPLLNMR